MNRIAVRTCLFGFLVAALSASGANGAVTKEQQRQLDDVRKKLDQARSLYVARKYEECGKLIVEMEKTVAELEGAENKDDLTRLLSVVKEPLEKARKALKAKGVELPEPPMVPDTPAGMISFTKQVAPMLTAKCGGCHINRSQGGFSMANFTSLMRGSNAGVVIFPGKSKGSRIVEVIEEGDMPRGGGKVSEEELALLTAWIDQGAKFDGDDPNASITGEEPEPERPMLTVEEATGDETISFSGDIAPVLASKCTGCHGEQRPRGDLSVASFTRLLRGGDSGLAIMPGKPAESLLVRKLKGQAGARMPLRQPPLSDEVIAKFEKWIEEGAKFDGPSPDMSVQEVASIYVAKKMSHEELAQKRLEQAVNNWNTAIPDDTAAQVETDNFLIYGNTNQTRLREIGERAEQIAEKVARVVRAPSSEPLIKGRLTIYVFLHRFDYSEYGRMVEDREIPRAWNGHFMYDVVDAYACLVPPKGEEYSLDLLLAELIAGAHVETLGDVPKWFSAGVGRAVAARIEPKAEAVQAWEDAVAPALTKVRRPEDLLRDGTLGPDGQAIAFGFCESLLSSRKFSNLLSELRDGKNFDQAFASTYGGTPVQVATPWAARAARG